MMLMMMMQRERGGPPPISAQELVIALVCDSLRFDADSFRIALIFYRIPIGFLVVSYSSPIVIL